MAMKINVKVGGRNTVLAAALANRLPTSHAFGTGSLVFSFHGSE